MRTDKEVKQEIEALKALEPKVPPQTLFGDNNHAAIDAQVRVLEDGLDEDDIYTEWPHDEEDMHIRDAALRAFYWLVSNGNIPSTEWQRLIS